MRIKVYYTTEKQREKLLHELGWWNHYDTYGADIMWDVEDNVKPKKYILVYGHACCEDMAQELKKICKHIEVEGWSKI